MVFIFYIIILCVNAISNEYSNQSYTMDLDLSISPNQIYTIDTSIPNIIKTSFNKTCNQYSINNINKFINIFHNTYLTDDNNTHYFTVLNIYLSSQQHYTSSLLSYQSISNNQNKLTEFIHVFENNIQQLFSTTNTIITNRLKIFEIDNNINNKYTKHILIDYSLISPTISPSIPFISPTVSGNTNSQTKSLSEEHILIYILSLIIIFIFGCCCALIISFTVQKVFYPSQRKEMDINQQKVSIEINKNMKTQTNKNTNIHQTPITKKTLKQKKITKPKRIKRRQINNTKRYDYDNESVSDNEYIEKKPKNTKHNKFNSYNKYKKPNKKPSKFTTKFSDTMNKKQKKRAIRKLKQYYSSPSQSNTLSDSESESEGDNTLDYNNETLTDIKTDNLQIKSTENIRKKWYDSSSQSDELSDEINKYEISENKKNTSYDWSSESDSDSVVKRRINNETELDMKENKSNNHQRSQTVIVKKLNTNRYSSQSESHSDGILSEDIAEEDNKEEKKEEILVHSKGIHARSNTVNLDGIGKKKRKVKHGKKIKKDLGKKNLKKKKKKKRVEVSKSDEEDGIKKKKVNRKVVRNRSNTFIEKQSEKKVKKKKKRARSSTMDDVNYCRASTTKLVQNYLDKKQRDVIKIRKEQQKKKSLSKKKKNKKYEQ